MRARSGTSWWSSRVRAREKQTTKERDKSIYIYIYICRDEEKDKEKAAEKNKSTTKTEANSKILRERGQFDRTWSISAASAQAREFVGATQNSGRDKERARLVWTHNPSMPSIRFCAPRKNSTRCLFAGFCLERASFRQPHIHQSMGVDISEAEFLAEPFRGCRALRMSARPSERFGEPSIRTFKVRRNLLELWEGGLWLVPYFLTF